MERRGRPWARSQMGSTPIISPASVAPAVLSVTSSMIQTVSSSPPMEAGPGRKEIQSTQDEDQGTSRRTLWVVLPTDPVSSSGAVHRLRFGAVLEHDEGPGVYGLDPPAPVRRDGGIRPWVGGLAPNRSSCRGGRSQTRRCKRSKSHAGAAPRSGARLLAKSYDAQPSAGQRVSRRVGNGHWIGAVLS